MPLVTRQVSNVGSPLYYPNGTLMANVKIYFTLVDSVNRDTDAFDVTTNERISGTVNTVTNSLGEFTINLWPNDRGDKLTKYLCRADGIPSFSSQVPSGVGYLSWYNFKHNGAILSPSELLALDAHIADANLHLSTFQNTLLDGLDQTLISQDLNATKGAKSNFQAQLDAMPTSPTKAPLLQGEPNGFIDASQVSLSWSNATRTLVISPVGASFQFYSDSVLFTKTVAESIVIPNVTSNYVVYYNTAGVLTASEVFDIAVILKYCFVASLYWNSTLVKAVPDVLNELHGCVMDSWTHLYTHNTHGTAFGSGIQPAVNATGDGSLPSHIQVASSSGTIWDEDLKHDIPSRIITDNLPVCYRIGASEWRMDDSASYVVIPTGTGRAAYNQNVGGNWQLTECPNNDYVLAHLYAVPGLTTKYVIIMGVATYATSALAREAARIEITNIVELPILEAKLIATFLVQSNNTFTNAVKSRLQQTISGSENFVDWRFATTVAGVPSHV